MSRLRCAFVGVGWIGRHRMKAALDTGLVEAVAVVDPSEEARGLAKELAPQARAHGRLEELFAKERDLDALVLATPSALHAEQALIALEEELAVFCQKPLARTAPEAARVVAAARGADRLLEVDLCYRYTRAFECVSRLVHEGALGPLYAARLSFHNGYGPDKPWFYDPELSGGGCLMDLGTHLVDLALSLFGFPAVENASARLFAKGRLLEGGAPGLEEHAIARLDVAGGRVVEIACSWNLAVGSDCQLLIEVHGERGGARIANVDGSFYDFFAERLVGTRRERLCDPPDAWGGRAIARFFEALARGQRFDPASETVVEVARVIDRLYGRDELPRAALAS